MASKNLGEIAALLTAFCWTLSGIAYEKAGKKVGSLAVAYIRLIIGFIFVSNSAYCPAKSCKQCCYFS